MSLLAPFFLLGLVGIGLPLWLHRLQTQDPKRQPISSAMLLDPSERRLHLQKRLRFLVLLALRIALLALLALAFAQPLMKLAGRSLPGQSARLHLIMVDTSMSMSAEGRMTAARAEAARIVEGLSGGDRATLIAAGSTMTVAAVDGGAPTADKSALQRALDTLQASEGRLDDALAMGSIDALAGTSELPVVVHLVSDFQSTGVASRFSDLLPRSERGRRIEVQLHPVALSAAPNWSVTGIRQSGDNIDVTVRGNGTPQRALSMQLIVNDTKRGEQTQTIPGNGEALYRFSGVSLNVGDNRVIAQLSKADALAVDDRYQVVLQGGGPRVVPLLTADVRAQSGTFTSAALAVSGAHYRVSPTRIGDFDMRTLERYRWVMVDDVGLLDASLAASLRQYVESGGAVLLAASQRAAALKALPVTGQSVRGVTVRTADPLSVGRVDATHAVLAGSHGWQSVSIARMLKVAPAASDRVLVAAEDGEPLLIEQRIGSGRVLLLCASLDNAWTDLPVQPVFVSFLAEAAGWLAGDEAYGAHQIAGALLPLAQAGATVGQVIDPEGHELLTLSATHNAQNVRLERSGFYKVITPARESLLAVNVDERESDLTPVDPALLERWRVAAKAAETVAPKAAAAQSSVDTLPLARWLLAVAALLVIAESLAGNWQLRRNTKVLT